MGQARQLTWDGCVNVRDLGGMPTEDGSETRYGAVVRADNLSTLSEQGRRELLAYGVKRVIDLRWMNERNEDPQVDLGVEVLHLPLFGDHNERREADRQLLERIRITPSRGVSCTSSTSTCTASGSPPRWRPLPPRPKAAWSFTARRASTAPASSRRCCCASPRSRSTT